MCIEIVYQLLREYSKKNKQTQDEINLTKKN